MYAYRTWFRFARSCPPSPPAQPLRGRVQPSGILLLALMLGACAKDPEPQLSSNRDPDLAVDAGIQDATQMPPIEVSCPPENPFCSGDAPKPICTSEAFDLLPSRVNVAIAIDGSASKASFWLQIHDAVRRMIEANQDHAELILDLFWAEPLESFDQRFSNANVCSEAEHKFLGPSEFDRLATFLGDQPPGVGDLFQSLSAFAELSSVINPLNYYLVHRTALDDPEATNYLVLISDGNDNCFGSIFAGADDKRIVFEKLTRELLKKGIRVLPIGFNATSQPVNPLNPFSQVTSDFDTLNAIARNGGTGLDQALAIDDPEQLQTAIQAVSRRIGNCRFSIPAALDPSQNVNPFELTFAVNGVEVERDRTGVSGWNFVQGDVSEVEFFGDACQALQAGQPVEARKACDTTNVCGVTAARVSQKPRAALYLLDRSVGMIDCSEGFLNCIPFLTPGLSWWGLSTRAITSSLAEPINEDIEFGIRYFPDTQLPLDCTVGPWPAVDPAPAMAVEVADNLLTTTPIGATPLVAGLERIVEHPGRIADEEVSGAVIVISGSADSCEADEPEIKQERLSAAARSLREQGVKVFAIRFGPQGESFAQHDAELRAIVRGAGTEKGDADDPNNVPYLDASDPDALNRALADISEQLATCVLQLGEVDAEADKSKINLYLDGDLIPFDRDTKGEGWAWLDEQHSEIELRGAACDRYKASRTTSIVVEFGCDSVPVL